MVVSHALYSNLPRAFAFLHFCFRCGSVMTGLWWWSIVILQQRQLFLIYIPFNSVRERGAGKIQYSHGRRGIGPGFAHRVTLERWKNVFQEIGNILFLAESLGLDVSVGVPLVADDAADCFDVVGHVPRGDDSLEGSPLKCDPEAAPLHCHDAFAVTLAKVVNAAKHDRAAEILFLDFIGIL